MNPTQTPKVCKNNGPKPILTALKATILHTVGVQVGLGDPGLEV